MESMDRDIPSHIHNPKTAQVKADIWDQNITTMQRNIM